MELNRLAIKKRKDIHNIGFTTQIIVSFITQQASL